MIKYQDFNNKKKHIAQNWGTKCDSEHLWKLVDELLEQYKLLEDNLEWRKKVEAREWGDEDDDTTYSIELTDEQRQKILKEINE